MRTVRNAVFAIALVFACEFAGVVKGAAAGSPIPGSTITIHVHNYAKVDDATLNEAEKVAAGIFQRAGVGMRWIDSDLTLEGKEQSSLGNDASLLSHILLSILPAGMAAHLDVPGNAMGLTPGNGADRLLVYVFYNRVEAVSQRQTRERQNREIALFASKSAILGYGIAHELGHVLLNLEVHSATGIMRGGWDKKDLMDIAYGSMGFTPEQSEVLREEAARRVGQQDILASTRLESSRQPTPDKSASRNVAFPPLPSFRESLSVLNQSCRPDRPCGGASNRGVRP